MSLLRRLTSAPAVFLLALVVRLGYLFAFDDALHRTEFSYLQGGLLIAAHETPGRFVWANERWRQWGDGWVVAPLYYLFLGSVFLLFGAQVRAVQVLQCGLGAATAVLVGAIGRRLEPRHGAWAGLAYALYWPALSLPPQLLSENVHTVLLVASIAVLLRDVERGGTRGVWAFVGGALLGLSALARAVSFLFVPVAGLWRWWFDPDRRRGRGLLVVAGAALMILPWSLRNALVIGDPIPIETLAYYNLYTVNSFVSRARLERYEGRIHKAPTPQARRALAVQFAWNGIRTKPREFLAKFATNARQLLRAEGLHLLFEVEWPRSGAWHAGNVLLGDGLLVPATLLFVAYLAAGARSPGRGLLGLWTLYYLFFLVVVYNSAVRYRSALAPFVLAAIPAGLLALRESRGKRRSLAWLLAAAVLAATLLPRLPVVAGGSLAFLRGLGIETALERGDLAGAARAARRASEAAPASVNPLLRYARALAERGHLVEALATYEKAQARRPGHEVAFLGAPSLWRQLGRPDEALLAQQEAEGVVSEPNQMHSLAAAWVWLAPPVADELVLESEAFGAADNFVRDHQGRRWTRHTALVRLRPRTKAEAYDVTIEMGSPRPSPVAAPRVVVGGPGGEEASFTLDRDLRPYRLRVGAPRDGIVRLLIVAPSWNRFRYPPDQGVVVARVSVAPAEP